MFCALVVGTLKGNVHNDVHQLLLYGTICQNHPSRVYSYLIKPGKALIKPHWLDLYILRFLGEVGSIFWHWVTKKKVTTYLEKETGCKAL